MIRYLFVIAVSVGWIQATVFIQPEHVHLALGENRDEMVVTWNTQHPTEDSQVEFGTEKMDQLAVGDSVEFVDGDKGRKRYIHKVTLTGLKPNTTYKYHCGSTQGWSSLFFFKTFPEGDNWVPHLAIFGDLGNKDGKSLGPLQQETQAGVYDAILHIGDFAYDFHHYEGETGDEFMRQIEPIAAYLPYMVSPGNHEWAYNFSHYRARFNMPGDTDGMYYSYNIGPVHFISFSSEHYFDKQLVTPQYQYEWLEQELIEATKPENRKKHPWIITLAHQPFYCTSDNNDYCVRPDQALRVGEYGVEALFYKYGVDVELWAHEHTYERLWPIYDYKVYNGSLEEPYVNPKAPVNIMTGSAGCLEGHDQFKEAPDWLAFRSRDNGYTRFTAYNASHLYMEQVSVDQNKVIDSVWVVKDEHVPYTAVDVNLPKH